MFPGKHQKPGGDKRGTRLCEETLLSDKWAHECTHCTTSRLTRKTQLLPFHNSQLAKELLRIRGLPYEYLSHELWPQCTTADQGTHLFKN